MSGNSGPSFSGVMLFVLLLLSGFLYVVSARKNGESIRDSLAASALSFQQKAASVMDSASDKWGWLKAVFATRPGVSEDLTKGEEGTVSAKSARADEKIKGAKVEPLPYQEKDLDKITEKDQKQLNSLVSQF